jgi:hypothetical protein
LWGMGIFGAAERSDVAADKNVRAPGQIFPLREAEEKRLLLRFDVATAPSVALAP